MRYTKCRIIRTKAPFNTREYIPVKQRPARVALLIDEKRFIKNRGEATHRKTIFILDRLHDWDYCEKRNAIRVYGSIDPDDPFDIVVAYEIADDEDGHKIWAKVTVCPGDNYDSLITALNGWQSHSLRINKVLAEKIRDCLNKYLDK